MSAWVVFVLGFVSDHDLVYSFTIRENGKQETDQIPILCSGFEYKSNGRSNMDIRVSTICASPRVQAIQPRLEVNGLINE